MSLFVVSLYSQNTTTMTQTSTIQRVQEYKGKNSFIGKMKDTLTKYGKLTPKQEEVVVNILKKRRVKLRTHVTLTSMLLVRQSKLVVLLDKT